MFRYPAAGILTCFGVLRGRPFGELLPFPFLSELTRFILEMDPAFFVQAGFVLLFRFLDQVYYATHLLYKWYILQFELEILPSLPIGTWCNRRCLECSIFLASFLSHGIPLFLSFDESIFVDIEA